MFHEPLRVKNEAQTANEPTLSLVFPQCSTQAAAAPKAGKSHKPRMMCRTLIEMEAKHENGTIRFNWYDTNDAN